MKKKEQSDFPWRCRYSGAKGPENRIAKLMVGGFAVCVTLRDFSVLLRLECCGGSCVAWDEGSELSLEGIHTRSDASGKLRTGQGQGSQLLRKSIGKKWEGHAKPRPSAYFPSLRVDSFSPQNVCCSLRLPQFHFRNPSNLSNRNKSLTLLIITGNQI